MQRFRQQESCKRYKVIRIFGVQILKGIAYMHSRLPPVIHCDLNCDNLFVSGQCGQVKIGDFGFAINKESPFAKNKNGTPEFMA